MDHHIGVAPVGPRRLEQIERGADAGVHLRKARQQRRNVDTAKTKRRTDAQRPRQITPLCCQRVGQCLNAREDVGGLLGQLLALARERDASRATLGERKFELRFQALESHGQRRRRHIERSGCTAERLVHREAAHQTQVFELQAVCGFTVHLSLTNH
jgi:hypothetical protein